MNTNREKDRFFKEAAARLHQQTGIGVAFEMPPIGEPGQDFDAVATLQVEALQEKFIVEAKAFLTAQNIEMAVRQARHAAELTNMRPLLIANYINPIIAGRLREDGINYLDAAGNAHLRDGKRLYVDIQGQRRPELPGERRALTPKGLQLVALLLAHPQYVNRTAREMAAAAGIALGNVPPMMADFEKRGYIGRKGPKEFVLREGTAMLEDWVRGYAELQRPRLLRHRYRLAPGTDIMKLADALANAGADNVLVGGEAAAAVYTRYLRPAGATLHLMDKMAQLPAKLLLPDARGNVDVLKGFGTAEAWQGDAPGCVHPLLVYGELLAIGGHDRRLAETAELLRENYGLGRVDLER
jgi:hypothetical protein